MTPKTFTLAEVEKLLTDIAAPEWCDTGPVLTHSTQVDLATALHAALVRDAETDARIEALESGVQFVECACGHDTKTDVCLGHAPIVNAIVAKRMAERGAEVAKLREALAPFGKVADAYDANELDDEARKRWDHGTNVTAHDQIELYQGRGGKRLITLHDCMVARAALKVTP